MRTLTRTVALSVLLVVTACADVSDSDELIEREPSAEGEGAPGELATQERALINPNLANPVTPLDPGIITIDPGGVLLPGGTKKTPCEKASNQFYRAQAAYLAAADALTACGFSFEPRCATQAATFFAAADVLDAAYAKFLQECP